MTKRILALVVAALLLICGFAFAEECADGEHVHSVSQTGSGTCADPYKIVETCKVCGKTLYTETIAGDHVHSVKTIPANCTDDEVIVETCKVCGEELDRKVISGTATGHKHAVRIEAATCVSDKKITEYCAVCGVTIANEVEAGKDANNHANVVAIPAVAPTCTATGLTEGSKCTACGEIVVAQKVVAKAAHTEVEIPAVAPTCTETGLTAGAKCSVCGEITKAQQVVPALGHTDVVIPAVEPTCTETGLTAGAYCSVCNVTTKAQEVVPALGHDYSERVVKPTTENRGFTEIGCTRCDFYLRTKYTDKLTAEGEVAVVVDAELNGYGSIVTTLEDEARDYTTHFEEEDKCFCVEAVFEGEVELRELHLTLALIEQLKAEGIEQVCFHVGEAEIVVPFASFEGETMDLVKADFPAELTGYVITLDPTAENEEGVVGCLVKVEMSADTAEEDGIEMEITDVMTGMTLLLNGTPITVVGGGVYTA